MFDGKEVPFHSVREVDGQIFCSPDSLRNLSHGLEQRN